MRTGSKKCDPAFDNQYAGWGTSAPSGEEGTWEAHDGQHMARVTFTENLQRHIACPPVEATGATVRDVLQAALAGNARALGYVLDDQGGLRKHMAIFVNGRLIRDRAGLSDAVGADDSIYVMQALSGG